MYNPKEKISHLRKLMAVEHAESDLQLLKEVDPQNSQIDSFAIATARNAEQILYTLLDFATAQQVRENRREINQEEDKESEEPKDPAVEQIHEFDPNTEPEKKNQPKPKPKAKEKKPKAVKKAPSKSTKSTQTSSGKTSKTKTSK